MHPTARLHVTNLEREGKPLDRRLLSSTQLHSLRLSVYYDELDQNLYPEGCRSELRILKGYLMLGNSIKKLDLSFEDAKLTIHDKALIGLKDCAHGPLNFHWQEGDRFPTLEEWTMSESFADYAYTAQHMDMWHRCMDWSLLRVLDLGRLNMYPSSMLPIISLTGHVPRFESLSLAVFNYNENAKKDPKRSLSILEEFLRNVLGLQSLRLEWEGIPDCLPIILQHQGSTLRELGLEDRGDTAPWSHQLFFDILSKAPQLCHLKVETSNQHSEFELEGRWSGKAVNSSPSEKYKSMEHMHMSFQVNKAKAEASVLKRLNMPYVLRRAGRYELSATGVTWIRNSP